MMTDYLLQKSRELKKLAGQEVAIFLQVLQISDRIPAINCKIFTEKTNFYFALDFSRK